MPKAKRRRSGSSTLSSAAKLLKRVCLKNIVDSDSLLDTPRTLLVNMGMNTALHTPTLATDCTIVIPKLHDDTNNCPQIRVTIDNNQLKASRTRLSSKLKPMKDFHFHSTDGTRDSPQRQSFITDTITSKCSLTGVSGSDELPGSDAIIGDSEVHDSDGITEDNEVHGSVDVTAGNGGPDMCINEMGCNAGLDQNQKDSSSNSRSVKGSDTQEISRRSSLRLQRLHPTVALLHNEQHLKLSTSKSTMSPGRITSLVDDERMSMSTGAETVIRHVSSSGRFSLSENQISLLPSANRRQSTLVSSNKQYKVPSENASLFSSNKQCRVPSETLSIKRKASKSKSETESPHDISSCSEVTKNGNITSQAHVSEDAEILNVVNLNQSRVTSEKRGPNHINQFNEETSIAIQEYVSEEEENDVENSVEDSPDRLPKTPKLPPYRRSPKTTTKLHARNKTAQLVSSSAEKVSTDKCETLNSQQQLEHRRRRAASSSTSARIPRSLTVAAVKHFCGTTRLSSSAVDAVEKIADEYWTNLVNDLSDSASSNGRRMVDRSDMELLMRRQGLIADGRSLNVLIETYLPLEVRQELIPVARSGNKIELTPYNH